MRTSLAVAAVLITYGNVSLALAATATTSFGVTATVIATCSIATQALLSHPEAAARSTSGVCLPGTPPFDIPAPRATVTFTRDPASGASILAISF